MPRFAVLLALFVAVLCAPASLSSPWDSDGGGGGWYNPPPRMNPPSMPPPVRPPVMPPVVMPPNTPMPTPVNPIDVTNPMLSAEAAPQNPQVLSGISVVEDFPTDDKLNGSQEWILVRPPAPDKETDYQKLTPYSVSLKTGTVLVSVRRPSRIALVKTSIADVSTAADSDVLLSFSNATLRIVNLHGQHQVVKVKPHGSDKAIALLPGYELVVADHKLLRSEVKPADGFARRNFAVLGDGKISVCEIFVESILHRSTLIVGISNATDPKEKRVLADMSKMAAVLNYVHGTQGYDVTGSQTASK